MENRDHPPVALVTGASKGIGLHIARELAKLKFYVITCSRGPAGPQWSAHDHRALDHRRCDINSRSQIAGLLSHARRRYKRIDLLVNNAAILGPIGLDTGINPKEWLATIKNNLYGTFCVMRAVLPFMMRQKTGKIINITGGGAGGPMPRYSAYAASKAALARLTENWALDFKPYGIWVYGLAPGMVKSDMHLETIKAGSRKAGAGYYQTTLKMMRADQGKAFANISRMLAFLATQADERLSGCVLSAQWDNPQQLQKLRQADPDLFKLRRIDNAVFKKNGS